MTANDDLILLGVRLDPELHKEFKVKCAQEGVKMSEVMRSLIREWLKESSPTGEQNREGGTIYESRS